LFIGNKQIGLSYFLPLAWLLLLLPEKSAQIIGRENHDNLNAKRNPNRRSAGISMKAESIKVESIHIAVVDIGTLARNWWVVLLRGIAGVLFGLATFFAPGISLAELVLLFGAFAFADGLLAIVTAIRRRGSSDRWWMVLLHGLAGVAVGVATVIWLNITALALVYLIAAGALVTGGLEICRGYSAAQVYLGRVAAHIERARCRCAWHGARTLSWARCPCLGSLDRGLCAGLGRAAHRARLSAALVVEVPAPTAGTE
jgi:uncharacterized membrane protein HdeD (DUF308 family)